jgi:DNA ligase-1
MQSNNTSLLRSIKLIQSLEQTSSRNQKIALLKQEAAYPDTVFFHGAGLALNSLITFGIKQIPTVSEEESIELSKDSWQDFLHLTDNLRTRQLTGSAAKTAVESLIKVTPIAVWNYWYRRILMKDLACGVDVSTINKALVEIKPESLIPVFECQLAQDGAKHEAKMKGKKYVETKLDGVRVLTILYPDGQVIQYSRNGKELLNFTNIINQFKDLLKYDDFLKDIGNEPIVLDGEITSGSFRDLMKQVHRKEQVETSDAILHLFDIFPLKQFLKGVCANTQEVRSNTIYYLHKKYKDCLPNVLVVGHELVDLDTVDGKRRFSELNRLALAGGYEGLMLKDPAALYECKRSVNWLKIKPYIEVSLKVVGFEEGTGKNKQKLGALLCQGYDEDREIIVSVGGGFTDEQRELFWKQKESLLEQIVEIRADTVTQNQQELNSYSLRFPRFLHFRGFKPGEKL